MERAAGRRRYGACCRVPTPLFHSLRRRTADRLQISRGVVCAGTLTSVRGRQLASNIQKLSNKQIKQGIEDFYGNMRLGIR